MTSYCHGTDAQSNRIDRSEILRRRVAASDIIAVFSPHRWAADPREDQLAHLRLASNDNNIAPVPFRQNWAPEILLQMFQPFGSKRL